ncbi:MAG TPA: Spy/CpxP family protein refolding chaperone [Ignavibacteriaceae bacterium]|nr:Spy/CpxP family protein refolding chaperone [Ignavibacteriaceae bacterium]
MKTLITSLSTILILSFIISGNIFAQPKHKFHKKIFKENVFEKLNLTEEQENKISDLRTVHQKEMIDLKADLKKKMIDMRDLRNNSDLKRSELISAVESMNAIKNQITLAVANHRMDVFELLNDDQKKIWQEHKPFRELFKMKFKGRGFGHEDFGFNEFDPEPNFDNDEGEFEIEGETED